MGGALAEAVLIDVLSAEAALSWGALRSRRIVFSPSGATGSSQKHEPLGPTSPVEFSPVGAPSQALACADLRAG